MWFRSVVRRKQGHCAPEVARLRFWVIQQGIQNILTPADVVTYSRTAISLRLPFYPVYWHGVGADFRIFVNANASDAVQLSLFGGRIRTAAKSFHWTKAIGIASMDI